MAHQEHASTEGPPAHLQTQFWRKMAPNIYGFSDKSINGAILLKK